MSHANSLKMGAALAATATIGYALCTVVFWTWPDAAATFMNALFHGLDFRKLQADGSLFNFGAFLYAEVVMSVWAFGLGTLFSELARLFHAFDIPRLDDLAPTRVKPVK